MSEECSFFQTRVFKHALEQALNGVLLIKQVFRRLGDEI